MRLMRRPPHRPIFKDLLHPGNFIHFLVDKIFVLVFSTPQEVVLEAPSHSGGQPVTGSATVLLRCAIAYGFRNIQSLMRKIKAGKCEYDYVEVRDRSCSFPFDLIVFGV